MGPNPDRIYGPKIAELMQRFAEHIAKESGASRIRIAPHVTWSGPCPEREDQANLLAMLLRIHSAGLDVPDEVERDPLMPPSVLTSENLPLVAMMYAFYTTPMAEKGIRDTEAIHEAEAELLEFVETQGNPGFHCFG